MRLKSYSDGSSGFIRPRPRPGCIAFTAQQATCARCVAEAAPGAGRRAVKYLADTCVVSQTKLASPALDFVSDSRTSAIGASSAVGAWPCPAGVVLLAPSDARDLSSAPGSPGPAHLWASEFRHVGEEALCDSLASAATLGPAAATSTRSKNGTKSTGPEQQAPCLHTPFVAWRGVAVSLGDRLALSELCLDQDRWNVYDSAGRGARKASLFAAVPTGPSRATNRPPPRECLAHHRG